MYALDKRLAAEGLGAAFLLAGIIGSGIMAERLAQGNLAIALLANSIATGGVLVCLIYVLGPISGGHFNPAVSLSAALSGELSWKEFFAYTSVQVAGACLGAVLANLMFSLPAVEFSARARSGPGLLLGEFVATLGLLIVIRLCVRFRESAVPIAVAAYIVGAYWFTSSTSFANPAVALARSLSNTFAGIRPYDVPGFVLAQLTGALVATPLAIWLASTSIATTARSVGDHEEQRPVRLHP